MKAINIISHHATLAAAVEASGRDLSYNEPLARRDIRDIDQKCKQAILTEGGDVYFVYEGDINVLNKYSPWVSCIHSGDMSIAFIIEDTLHMSDPMIPKTPAGRKWFRNEQAMRNDVKILAA